MNKKDFPYIQTIGSISKLVEKKDYKMADALYDRIKQHIEGVSEKLEEDEQLDVYYYTRSGDPILVQAIGYHNPNVIRIYGWDSDKNVCNILVHMQSVELVLKIQKIESKKPKRRMGFVSD